MEPESYHQEFILYEHIFSKHHVTFGHVINASLREKAAMAPVYLASMREMLSEKTTSYLNSINYVRPIRVHCPHPARDFCVAPVPLD